MEKEVKPQRIQYKYAGKQTFSETLKKSIPKQFYPTKIMSETIGVLFLFVIIFAAFQFPYLELISGNTDATVKIGVPLTFLEFNLMNESDNPANLINLTLDIFIYILLSYAINVSINLIRSASFVKSKEERKKYPKLFRKQKETTVDKVTKKVFQDKVQPTPVQ